MDNCRKTFYLADSFYNDTRHKVDTILDKLKWFAGACMGIPQSDIAFFSPLQHAARSGDVGVIASLLASDSESVNATSSSTQYLTALHLAAYHGGVKTVKLLVQHGANVNALDAHGNQPLHHAARSRNNTIVKFLLKNGAKCTLGEHALTPLMIAATLGPKAIVETLLPHSSDSINATCATGLTPLFRAVIYREQEIVEVLLKHGSFLRTEIPCSPLSIAILGNNVEMVKILLPHVKKSPCDFVCDLALAVPAFNAALLFDWKEMVKILVDSDIFSLRNYTVLKTSMNVAATHGCAKVVEMLLEHGVDVDSETVNPTIKLEEHEDSYYVGTALHVAIEKGHIEVVKVLLNHKASLSCRDRFRRTPLEVAIARNRLDIVQLLDPKVKDLENHSYLHLAVQQGDLDMVKYLVDLGCDIHEKSAGIGLRPIHIAAGRGRIDMMQYFLSKGCTIGDKSHLGKTPLFMARLEKQTAMIDFLVSKGAIEDDEMTATEREAAKLVNDLGIAKDTTPIEPAQAKKSKKYLEVMALKNDMVDKEAVPAIKVAPVVRDTDSKERRGNASKRRERKNKLPRCEKPEKSEEVRQKEEDVTVPEPAWCLSKVEPVETDILPNFNCYIVSGLEINGEFYRQKDFYKIRDTKKGAELAKAAMLSAIKAKDSETLRKVVKEFISWKNRPAVVNSKSPSCGSTALHFAAQSGVLEMVKRLLHSGAMYNITNNAGLTPLNVAKGREIIDFLQLIEQSYNEAKNGNHQVLDRLKVLPDNDLRVIAGTTNVEGETIARVANVAGFRDLRLKFMHLFNVVDNY